MPALRTILLVLGVAMALVGGLWIGLGLGFIRWPASSFMLGARTWADYGSALAAGGLLLVLVARRLPRR